MNNQEIVDLMLKSSDNNPYTGALSKKDNLIAAIDLAKLCKDFADNGQTDEAMAIGSEQWSVVISELENFATALNQIDIAAQPKVSEVPRPQFKDYFPEGTTVQDIHTEFSENPELYQYVQALDSYIDYIESQAAQPLKNEQLEAMVGKEFTLIPLDIEGSNIANTGWMPCESDKKDMGEKEFDDVVKEYNDKNSKVIFKNVSLEWDSCDRDGYGCAHGQYVYEIHIKNGDKIHDVKYTDGDSLEFYNDGKYCKIPTEGATIADFIRMCQICKIELEFTDYALSLTTEVRAGNTPIQQLIDKLEQIKLKSIRPESKRTGEYRIGLNAAIDEARELLTTEAACIKATKGDGWISVEDKPLYTKDANGNWICTDEGDTEFIAAVPYKDKFDKEHWWIHHCVVEDRIGLCVVGDGDNEKAGWELEDVTHYQPLPPTPNDNKI